MPARKPTSLNSRNTSKELRAEREAAESAMMPKTELSAAVPVRLRGKAHTQAAATWKRTIKLYQEVAGTIVTAFDYDLLIDYCFLEEEYIELQYMRKTMKLDWEESCKAARKLKPKDAESIKELKHLWEVINALYSRFQGMDARLDGKRKLRHTLRQSLYLEPRSRAGAVPEQKEQKEDNPDDKFLSEA